MPDPTYGERTLASKFVIVHGWHDDANHGAPDIYEFHDTEDAAQNECNLILRNHSQYAWVITIEEYDRIKAGI